MHDTIGCYLDIDKGHVKFSKNGKPLDRIIKKKSDSFLSSLLLFSPLPYPASFIPVVWLWICCVPCALGSDESTRADGVGKG